MKVEKKSLISLLKLDQLEVRLLPVTVERNWTQWHRNNSSFVSCKRCSDRLSEHTLRSLQKDVTSSSAAGKGKKVVWAGVSSGRSSSEKPTELLNEQEFSERFCISNDISIHLVDGDPTSTKKEAQGGIFFSKEQFNAGLRLHLPSLLKQFLHYTQIPPAFIQPNIVWVLMGCNILDMLFHLDLSLLEVFFVYTIKKGKNDIFSMFAYIPSLQLVTGLPNSTKGGAKGMFWSEAHGSALLSIWKGTPIQTFR